MRIPWMLAISTLLFGLATPLDAAPPADASPKVGGEVYSALGHSSKVRVLIAFQEAQPHGAAAQRRADIEGKADALLAALPAGSHSVKRRFELVPALALEVDEHGLQGLAHHPDVLRVDVDAPGSGQLAEAKQLAHIMDVPSGAKLASGGGKIAIVDSGIDLTHPDFQNRIVGQQCYCSNGSGEGGCCPNGMDSMSGPGSAQDDNGHGTNVAGIAAGGGAVALPGAAPDAAIVAVKVLDSGSAFCCSSDVVSALDWIRINHPDTLAVNTSLGTDALFSGDCDGATSYTIALAAAVGNLVSNGTMVFAASGNRAAPNSTSAPACLFAAVSVGAVWDAELQDTTFMGCTDTNIEPDKPTCFTNSGASVDLYAPGAFVTASGLGGTTSTYGGTSQASPLAAGCATVLRSAFPEATPDEIAAALKASPTRITDPKNGLEFARLDCANAMLRLDGDTLFADEYE